MSDDGSSARNTAEASEGAEVRVLEIVNKKGLHARASAKFCQTVERFDADVRVTRGHETVGGTSIMGNNTVVGYGIRLGAAPPSNRSLTVTSGDPTHYLLSTNPTTVGSASRRAIAKCFAGLSALKLFYSQNKLGSRHSPGAIPLPARKSR